MKTTFLAIVILLCANVAFGQFWFGPKIGGQLTQYNFQDDTFEDRYKVETNINWNVGFAMEYAASTRYAIHTEINYFEVNNKFTNLPGVDSAISESTYKFLTVPLMMRFMAGIAPVTFYLNVGPRLTYWLGGSGNILADELIENGLSEGLDYSIKFTEPTQDLISQGNFFFVPDPNRLQYGFDVGGGIYLDIGQTQKINLDFRYSFGHSNMGFNNTADLGLIRYQEDIQYSHRIFRVSLSYLIGYDIQAQKKGKSTSRVRKR